VKERVDGVFRCVCGCCFIVGGHVHTVECVGVCTRNVCSFAMCFVLYSRRVVDDVGDA